MTEKKKPGRVGILSAIIDPLLFDGGKRVFQIANEVVTYFGNKYEKAQVVNNIRSRITFLTTRGYKFEKNFLKQVQLIKIVEEKAVLAIDSATPEAEVVTRSDAEVPVTETK